MKAVALLSAITLFTPAFAYFENGGECRARTVTATVTVSGDGEGEDTTYHPGHGYSHGSHSHGKGDPATTAAVSEPWGKYDYAKPSIKGYGDAATRANLGLYPSQLADTIPGSGLGQWKGYGAKSTSSVTKTTKYAPGSRAAYASASRFPYSKSAYIPNEQVSSGAPSPSPWPHFPHFSYTNSSYHSHEQSIAPSLSSSTASPLQPSSPFSSKATSYLSSSSSQYSSSSSSSSASSSPASASSHLSSSTGAFSSSSATSSFFSSKASSSESASASSAPSSISSSTSSFTSPSISSSTRSSVSSSISPSALPLSKNMAIEALNANTGASLGYLFPGLSPRSLDYGSIGPTQYRFFIDDNNVLMSEYGTVGIEYYSDFHPMALRETPSNFWVLKFTFNTDGTFSGWGIDRPEVPATALFSAWYAPAASDRYTVFVNGNVPASAPAGVGWIPVVYKAVPFIL